MFLVPGGGHGSRALESFCLVSAGFILVPWAADWCFRRYLKRKHTIVRELRETGKPRSDGKRIRGTAVVCGGSIAGLWTARICADHFEDVLIVEPDELAGGKDSDVGASVMVANETMRKRIVQYSSAHVYQSINMIGLRHLFPLVEDDIIGRGGIVLPFGGYVHTCYGKIHKVPPTCTLNVTGTPFISRHSYESILRKLVLDSSPRIRRIVGSVTALVPESMDTRSISTVTVRKSRTDNADDDGEVLNIPAVFVADCTGVTQAGLKWVKRLHEASGDDNQSKHENQKSWEGVRISYDMNSRFVTIRFQVPDELWTDTTLSLPWSLDETGVMYAFIPQAGLDNRYFIFNRLEGHRIEIACGGWGDPQIPENIDQLEGYFKTFASVVDLPAWIFRLVERLVQLEQFTFKIAKIPRLSYVRYHDAPFLPRNFVAVGDAVMNTNPIFGQGCGKALIGAIVLDSILRSTHVDKFNTVDVSKKYFEAHKNKLGTAWDGTKSVDYGFETTTPVSGETLKSEAFNALTSDLALELCAEDDKVDETLWYVRSFLAPTTDFISPTILLKLGFVWLKRVWGTSKVAKLRRSTLDARSDARVG